MAKKGLKSSYEKDEKLREYIDKLRYLALVPFYSIDECLTALIDMRNPKVAQLFRQYPALRELVFDYFLPVSCFAGAAFVFEAQWSAILDMGRRWRTRAKVLTLPLVPR